MGSSVVSIFYLRKLLCCVSASLETSTDDFSVGQPNEID
jgi:hypothetical protein